ncbi:uncharacterized protein LOC126969791 isoform X2 [Leptidea sinapis]|uniref:uncharacterized protein LOC126969791 isoform X2 n=1 Tax=Leptidea sinapis TaxID=189913 RepID=UPI0021C4B862|nr:uncharacterized protein LOC126969791 isoform X2 [Leptidea sinapis]
MQSFVCLLVAICGFPVSFADGVCKQAQPLADQVRGEYYCMVEDILREDAPAEEDHNLSEGVEKLIVDFIDKASQPPFYDECVPFVSEYTDCSKENICTGCTRCICDPGGRWNCSQVSTCRPSAKLVVDHHVLVAVMENLVEGDNVLKRRKRSFDEFSYDRDYEDIFKWMYGIAPFDMSDEINTPHHNTLSTTSFPDLSRYNTNTKEKGEEIIKFNHANNYESSVILENRKSNKPTDLIRLLDKVLAMTEPSNVLQKSSVENNNSKEILYFNLPRKIVERNVVESVESPVYATNNLTHLITEVMQECIVPMNTIIYKKFEELNELINVRDKLQNSITTHTGINVSHLATKYYINHTQIESDVFDVKSVFRRSNEFNLRVIKEKLVKDIQAVIRGLSILKRFSEKPLSVELQYLSQAFSHFMNRNNKLLSEQKNRKGHILNKYFRRNIIDNLNDEKSNIVLLINRIIELMDKNMPLNNVLQSLSRTVRKIMSRVISQYYTDEMAMLNLKINENKYNVVNNIKAVSNQIQDIMILGINYETYSKGLYHYKMLHLKVSSNIAELNDITTIVSFNQRRKMKIYEDQSAEIVIEKINSDLNNINKKYSRLIELQSSRDKFKSISIMNNLNNLDKTEKKMSFFQKIKKLFQKSKKDVRDLLKSKVPKSNIIDNIARRRIDEIGNNKLREYEEKLRQWQNSLNVAQRLKRSPKDIYKFVNRIKSIIPEYLHKKVKPAVDFKQKKNRTVTTKHRYDKRRLTTKQTELSATTEGTQLHN